MKTPNPQIVPSLALVLAAFVNDVLAIEDGDMTAGVWEWVGRKWRQEVDGTDGFWIKVTFEPGRRPRATLFTNVARGPMRHATIWDDAFRLGSGEGDTPSDVATSAAHVLPPRHAAFGSWVAVPEGYLGSFTLPLELVAYAEYVALRLLGALDEGSKDPLAEVRLEAPFTIEAGAKRLRFTGANGVTLVVSDDGDEDVWTVEWSGNAFRLPDTTVNWCPPAEEQSSIGRDTAMDSDPVFPPEPKSAPKRTEVKPGDGDDDDFAAGIM